MWTQIQVLLGGLTVTGFILELSCDGNKINDLKRSNLLKDFINFLEIRIFQKMKHGF